MSTKKGPIYKKNRYIEIEAYTNVDYAENTNDS